MLLITDNRWLGGEDDTLVPGYPRLRIQVRPIDDDMRDAGEDAYRDALSGMPRDESGKPVGETRDWYRRAWKAYAKALMRLGIVAWEGFEAAPGEALPVTEDYVLAAIGHPDIFDALDARYAAPFLTRHFEKNELALSQDGTSGAPMTTAVTTVDATAKVDAPRARTPKARLKRRKAGVSGDS